MPDELLNSETHGILTAIRGQAQACHTVIKTFNEEVVKYDPENIGHKPTGFRGAWNKTKWAHYFSPKLVLVRQAISAQVSILDLLVPTLQAQVLSKSCISNAYQHRSLTGQLAIRQGQSHHEIYGQLQQTDTFIHKSFTLLDERNRQSSVDLSLRLDDLRDYLPSKVDHATCNAALVDRLVELSRSLDRLQCGLKSFATLPDTLMDRLPDMLREHAEQAQDQLQVQAITDRAHANVKRERLVRTARGLKKLRCNTRKPHRSIKPIMSSAAPEATTQASSSSAVSSKYIAGFFGMVAKSTRQIANLAVHTINLGPGDLELLLSAWTALSQAARSVRA